MHWHVNVQINSDMPTFENKGQFFPIISGNSFMSVTRRRLNNNLKTTLPAHP
jgi:hypothetical protein